MLEFLRIPLLIDFLDPLLATGLDLVTKNGVKEGLGDKVSSQRSFELRVGLGSPGEESLEEFGLRGSKVVIEALLVVGKTRWEEREDERAKEIFVVGLRVEEGLFVTELLVPEVQTKIFLTKVVFVFAGLLVGSNDLGFLNQERGSEITELLDAGVRDDALVSETDLILTQEFPAGLELAGLEVALDKVFARECKREIKMSSSRRIGKNERSFSVDLVREV